MDSPAASPIERALVCDPIHILSHLHYFDGPAHARAFSSAWLVRWGIHLIRHRLGSVFLHGGCYSIPTMGQPSHPVTDGGCNGADFYSRVFYGSEVFDDAHTLEAYEALQESCPTICARCPGPRCEICGSLGVHTDSVIISVDGACRGNDRPDATAACAVFFAPDSPYNEAHILAAADATSQRAELMGGIKALEAAKRLVAILDGDLKQVVIKADSAYLVRGATEWVFKWKGRGWTNAKGGPVVNQDLFRQLETRILDLEHMGMLVQFFHVPRLQNRQADSAANEALDNEKL